MFSITTGLLGSYARRGAIGDGGVMHSFYRRGKATSNLIEAACESELP